MLREYDVVVLKREVAGIPVRPTTEGAIVHVHDSQPPGAYEVEFFDESGNSLCVYTVTGDNLELKTPYRDDASDKKG